MNILVNFLPNLLKNNLSRSAFISYPRKSEYLAIQYNKYNIPLLRPHILQLKSSLIRGWPLLKVTVS